MRVNSVYMRLNLAFTGGPTCSCIVFPFDALGSPLRWFQPMSPIVAQDSTDLAPKNRTP